MKTTFRFLLTALLLSVVLKARAGAAEGEAVLEQERALQVAYTVDVVIAGGSSAAVAAAVAAKEQGASVILVTDRPYLGEDLCSTLSFAPPQRPLEGLASELFPEGRQTTPLRIKKALDQALLHASVDFLTGSYPVELVTDKAGTFAGITMINRSGRQFIEAKVLIDATEHATLARQARLPFLPFEAGEKEFRMRVIGGELQHGPALTGRTLAWTVEKGRAIHEYRLRSSLKTGDWSELCRVEERFRDLVIQAGVLEHSERMDYHLGTQLNGPLLAEWPGASTVNLAHFGHDSNPRVLVLGKYAALSDTAAMAMQSPREFLAIGARLGHVAGARSANLDLMPGEAFGNRSSDPVARGAIGERSHPLRVGTIKQTWFPQNTLPVLGSYEVVVVGGGTSGGPAAIGAAERGASTLVIEYLDQIGGVGTSGLVGKYWLGLRGGFTKRIDQHVQSGRDRWDPIRKSDWLRRSLSEAHGDIWFRSFGCGVLVEDGLVKGVVVATPQGRGLVLARTVVDSTGNADIAAHAGAPTEFSIDRHGQLSVQLAGYPHRNLGDSQNNTAYAIVDDCDALDLWNLMLNSRQATRDSYFDMGQLVDSRDRRRIIADYVLTTADIFAGRTFTDTIAQASATIDVAGTFDSAAFRTSPILLPKNIKGATYIANMPYRSFIPRGISGVIATGIGAGVDQDAMTLTRMHADMQNQGYALGIAAAMTIEQNVSTREIDLKSLQADLVAKGVITLPTDNGDSVPAAENELRAAVADVATMPLTADWERPGQHQRVGTFKSLATIMLHPRRSLPFLREALEGSTNRVARVNYAKILSALDDPAGREVLLQEVTNHSWDMGKPLGVKRRYQNSDYREMDQLVIPLSRCDGPEVEAALAEKVATLRPDSPWSHYRVMAIALRKHRIQSAVPSLVGLLQSKGFSGHARHYAGENVADRRHITGKRMNASLRELTTAGMLYALGDYKGMGHTILAAYKNDISGHLARYADAFLKLEPPEVLLRDPEAPAIIHPPAPTAPSARVPVQAPNVYTSHVNDLLIADFEGGDYGEWTVTGDAFGPAPAQIGRTPNTTAGALGKGFVNSFRGGDGPTGTLVSPPFTVQRKYLNFLVGGGNHSSNTAIELVVEGKPVHSRTGTAKKDTQHREVIRWASWNIEPLKGKQAQIRIIDDHSAGWGHILVDHIYQSDIVAAP